jgi:hypothetical protein
MHTDDMGRHPFDEFEAGPPDQRTIAEHPEIIGGMVKACIHVGPLLACARSPNRLRLGSQRGSHAMR